ncbi:MotA/TolQ/ExbB proton channel family protein [Novosphingobium taihuense]|uniref:Chemotaxis protein MotA n=1 Tax=Novosphingobium taihuense TaxID=260085 RepID=A0A7W7ESD5_9SPHN|nr:MotA/TolQ/ExbB proton channel family protein [Novosphingobium taihuense]MBB4611854.1 chemotaxis protein MotA [Novosphingobium taihuense]TWH88791.1 chemotaxis protein MotA [Novosphingobium taihuense]
MPSAPLFDGLSLGIVLGGTALATVLRSGRQELNVTMRALAGLFAARFSATKAKADLASQVSAICRDGILRARSGPIGDREFDDATDALVRSRSLDVLIERHHTHRRARLAAADTAVRTLAQAAELGPVFGMVGTLVSLSRLPTTGLDQGALNATVAMAVMTTLYGLLLANLVLAPLARAVERRSQDEERQRQDVIEWLSGQLEPALSAHAPVHRLHPRGRAAG